MIVVEVSRSKLEREIAELERQASLLVGKSVATQNFCLGASHALRQLLDGGQTASELVSGVAQRAA